METKKRKFRRTGDLPTHINEGSQEISENNEDQLDKKKSLGRREMRDKLVMERYHDSQRKQGILKKNINKITSQDNQTDVADDHNGDEEIDEMNFQNQAKGIMNEFCSIKQEEKKQLKREKKEFKKQQKLKIRNENSYDSEKSVQKKNSLKDDRKSEEITTESKQDKALSYLSQWQKNPQIWKFKKNFHIWLLKNWNQSPKIDDENFLILLKYLNEIDKKSKAIERLQEEAQEIVNNVKESSVYERAREILQWLN